MRLGQGASPWKVPDADGHDGKLTSIKIPTTGTFAYGGNPAPGFTVRYRVKIK